MSSSEHQGSANNRIFIEQGGDPRQQAAAFGELAATAAKLQGWPHLRDEQMMISERWVNFTPDKQFPKNWAFQTREGGTGILQVIGITEKSGGVEIRYKMVIPQPGPQRIEQE